MKDKINKFHNRYTQHRTNKLLHTYVPISEFFWQSLSVSLIKKTCLFSHKTTIDNSINNRTSPNTHPLRHTHTHTENQINSRIINKRKFMKNILFQKSIHEDQIELLFFFFSSSHCCMPFAAPGSRNGPHRPISPIARPIEPCHTWKSVPVSFDIPTCPWDSWNLCTRDCCRTGATRACLGRW